MKTALQLLREKPRVDDSSQLHYRILYRVSGEDVQVVAVVHSARLLPRTPPV